VKNFLQKSKSVFYTSKFIDFIELSNQNIKFLVNKNNLLNKKSRICLHKNENSKIHEMLIMHKTGAYVRPHKHTAKTESFILLKGKLKVIVFNNKGDIFKIIDMGPIGSSKTFYYKMQKSYFHSFIIEKESFFFEITKGPFRVNETIFPKWAPLETDKNEIKKFQKTIIEKVNKL
jgi:cupin fold WbuC family metalloprotein